MEDEDDESSLLSLSFNHLVCNLIGSIDDDNDDDNDYDENSLVVVAVE
jgi:hypothetical protein